MAQPTSQSRVGSCALVFLAGAIVVSCREVTAPPDQNARFTVAVTEVVGPSFSSDSSGRQLIACDLTLQANNAASQRAAWLDATFGFYLPGDSTTPFSVDTLPAAAIAASWGADSIGPGAAQVAYWHLSATVPFALRIRFSYQLAHGATGTTEVATSCEPTTVPGPPPVITTLTYQPDTLEPGDTLHLSYAATSSVELWESVIRISGPCDTTLLIPEQLRLAVAHEIALVMPPGCALGVPLAVTASAFDARLQGTSRALTLPALVDHRAPALTVLIRTPYNDWASPDSIAAYLFTGDAIALSLKATDNHSLHAISWAVQPAGYRDSTLVIGTSAFMGQGIPAQAGWVGPIQLQLYATDAAGNVSDTAVSAPGGIQVYPTVGPAPTPMSIPGDITDVAFDTKRGVIYLLLTNPDQIAVLSSASASILRTIPLPAYAPAFDLAPSGDSMVIALMNLQAIGVVDLTQATPSLGTVPLAGMDSTYRLVDMRVAASGQALIAAQHQVLGGESRLYTYALANGTLQMRLDAPALGFGNTAMIERSTDGSVVVVNSPYGAFVRYDAATDAFEAAYPPQMVETRPSVDATAAHVAVSGDLYDASLQYLRTVRVAKNGEGPGAISPDGQTHYMAVNPTFMQWGIVRSRVADGSIVDHIAVPMLISTLRIAPDGSTLLAIGRVNGVTEICLVNLLQLH